MTPIVFDRALIARRLGRAVRDSVDGADVLLAHAAADLADRVAAVSRRFPVALTIAPPSPLLAEAIAATGQVDHLIRADLLVRGADGRHPADLVLDDEVLPLRPGSLDLVVSALTLTWVNDLPGALVQIRRALRPDGLFLAVLAGGDTLGELRDAMLSAEVEATGGAHPRVAPFADLRDLGGLLQRAGFALPVTDVDRLTLRYRDSHALMRDLRAMGATSPLAGRSRRPLTRRFLLDVEARYRARAADPDGKIRATVMLLSASGWSPHDSQQKPLRPGSATARLADALGTREERLGPETN